MIESNTQRRLTDMAGALRGCEGEISFSYADVAWLAQATKHPRLAKLLKNVQSSDAIALPAPVFCDFIDELSQEEPRSEDTATDADKSQLEELGIPYHDVLEAAGIKTVADFHKHVAELPLTSVNGIGESRAKEVAAAIAAIK